MKFGALRFVLGGVVALSLFGAAGLAQASSITSPQLSAIVGLLQAFGASQEIVANVAAVLGGTSTAAAIGVTTNAVTLTPGSDLHLTYTFNGVNRTYILHVPQHYVSGKKYPLVFSIHGAGGTAAGMEHITGMSTVADQDPTGFFVVYPETNPYYSSTHEWQFSGSSNDIDYLQALTPHIESVYPIDTTRVYLSGYSEGSGMSQRLICTGSPLFASVWGDISSNLNKGIKDTCAPSRPITVVLFHGTADKISPYGGGQNGLNGGITYSTAATAQYWAQYDGCTASTTTYLPGDVLNNGKVVTDIQDSWSAGCKSGTNVTLYTIPSGGHTWPGGTQDNLAGSTLGLTSSLPASKLLWAAFNAQSVVQVPTVTLTATPATISSGQSVTLRWSSTNAASCGGLTASPGGINNPTSGSITVTPTKTTTYSITCFNTVGAASANATVTVVAPPPLTATCTVSPASITTGSSATWTAAPTGGVAPYAYYWSGTGSLTGTAASVTKTYTTAGTKNGSVTVTDNAGTTYTPTCPNLTVGGTAGAFRISPLLSTQDTFPGPFSIVNPANPDNDHKIGSNFVFYSTQDKMLYFPSLTAGTPPAVTIKRLNVDSSFIQNRLNPKFSIFDTMWSKNVFYDQATCRWHMIASVFIKENNWQDKEVNGTNIWPAPYQTSVLHLSPDYTTCNTDPAVAWNNIKSWTVDGELVGRVPTVATTTYNYANYAGKLMQGTPSGPLYLVYVAQLQSKRNDIVAQPMLNAYTVDTSRSPIPLLTPDPALLSENRDGASAMQLVETGNILKINQTWVLLYSVGDYKTNNYKIGIAYSDSLTGPYTKVFAKDTNNVWGENVGGNISNEVAYLLQSQKQNWLNFTSQVIAPGVPTILHESVAGQTQYFLTFAGYPPGTPAVSGQYDPAARISYFAPLAVTIPNDPTAVADSTNADRQQWVTVQKQ